MSRLTLGSLIFLAACSSSSDTSPTADDAGALPQDGSSPLADGGSAGDAASPADAAPGDAQADAAATGGCTGKSYKLCDDFDKATVGSTPTGWTMLKGYAGGASPPGTIVAADDFHSPPYSVKTSADVAGANRIQRSLASIGTTAGTHWGRVFWKVKAPPPQLTTQGPHAPFVALQGNLRAGELRVVDTQQAASGKIQLLVNTPDDQCCAGTDFSYTIWDGKWHCSEWYVDHVTQSYRYFLDKTEVKSIGFSYGAGSTKANMPTAFTTVGLGTIFFTATLPTPLVTWFDDIAIDDQQIGCD